jgi:hypothetical protein
MDVEFFAAAGGQHVQVETRRPFLVPFERVLLRIVAEVPDLVHRTALLVKQSVERLHPVAIDKNHTGHSKAGMSPIGGTSFLPTMIGGVSPSN